MSDSLGITIRSAREAQGLSLRLLARLIGANPTQVLRWENDDAVPSPKALALLAEQLELRASELFTLAGVPLPSDLATLPAMLRADYDLPPEAIADIEQYIDTVAKQYRDPTKRSSSRNERRET
ncbi:multiprotein-bridging factor 1 family protein [uncultured Jatrophihabitans sp.]|uniref:helix-turn-helix domain-containing protein n=1 Tax=uncultured Jatrophihabitans sp. TaxID=1610747 RepID=UPI0035CB8E65